MNAVQLLVVDHILVVGVRMGNIQRVGLFLGAGFVRQGNDLHVAQTAQLLDVHRTDEPNANHASLQLFHV